MYVWKSHWKHLEYVQNLGGAGSQRIAKVGQMNGDS